MRVKACRSFKCLHKSHSLKIWKLSNIFRNFQVSTTLHKSLKDSIRSIKLYRSKINKSTLLSTSLRYSPQVSKTLHNSPQVLRRPYSSLRHVQVQNPQIYTTLYNSTQIPTSQQNSPQISKNKNSSRSTLVIPHVRTFLPRLTATAAVIRNCTLR